MESDKYYNPNEKIKTLIDNSTIFDWLLPYPYIENRLETLINEYAPLEETPADPAKK